MSSLGIDIGGANLKVSDGEQFALSVEFPLWREPLRLSQALAELLSNAPAADELAVTMTGELADCYRTKAEGVAAIVAAMVSAAGDRRCRFYRIDGSLVSAQEAIENPLLTAASNWHVLARYAAQLADCGSALLLDIGSTTCDVIPLVDGSPAAQGTHDTERLAHGELVYTGVVRSPLCSVIDAFEWRAMSCPLAQEVFATTLDAYLMLGDYCEDASNHATADGRSATREYAHERLARAICADRDLFNESDALAAAQAVAERQVDQIASAAVQVAKRLPVLSEKVILSGQGEFLARRVVGRLGWGCEIVSLSEVLGANVSGTACAYSLAHLSQEIALS